VIVVVLCWAAELGLRHRQSQQSQTS
jgi:hypothetical protein